MGFIPISFLFLLNKMKILIISEKGDFLNKLEKTIPSKDDYLYHLSKTENIYPLIRKNNIKTIIINLDKEDINGFPLLKDIKKYDPLIDVVIIGPNIPASKMVEAIKWGATEYLVKPVDPRMTLSVLERIKQKVLFRKKTFQLEKELADKYIFEGMVGRSVYMLDIFSLIEKVAKYTSSILITGETGTGKEMAARAVHNLGPRKNKPFVACDCVALPESLFESELFGYVKGAFTGAYKSKNGLFKEANEGTIFLDEIAEIPYLIQAKLLRVLEERKFRPLGTNKVEKVEVRVVASTNRDIREEVEQNRFREDLFHRINVVEIKLPPLRKRKEDIRLISLYFIKKYNQKLKKNILGISRRGQKILLDYDWPGNVRELENTIERAVMMCREKFLDIRDFPDYLIQYRTPEENQEFPYPYSHLTLEEIERKHILEILKAANYNKKKTSQILGLTRQALYRKLKRLQIPF